MAKDRLKDVYPSFNGFSSRGDSSLLPCLGGDCGDGVIDEVFMGTSQSCMELYRLKPSVPHSPTDHKEPSLGERPWQDLLVRGDQLLRELQTQDLRSGDQRHEASTSSKGQACGQQHEIASNVVAHAADVVEAIGKLADVLGSGTSSTEVGKHRPAGLNSGSGLLRARPGKSGASISPLSRLPACDPIPDDPSPLLSDGEERIAARSNTLNSKQQAYSTSSDIRTTTKGSNGRGRAVTNNKSKSEKAPIGNAEKTDDLPGKIFVSLLITQYGCELF